MKTCPACHRSVPDNAVKCPHQGCGAALDSPRPHAKRPPPPPAHVDISRHDAHPPRRRRLAWVAVISVGAAVVAGILLVLSRSDDHGNKTAALNPAAPQPISKPATKPAAAPRTTAAADGAASGESRHKAAEKPKTTNEQPAEKPKTPPATPSEPLGIVDEPAKALPAEKPNGMVADKPTGKSEEPALGIVADTPLELYAERTKPKTEEWLGERGGTIESQQAVEDGLNWLARHQGEDGHWGADCLGTVAGSRCAQKTPCEGPGEAFEVAHTGMALLAFQAAGHYYFNGQKYSDHVTKGLNYLVEEQTRDGSIVGSQNPTQDQIDAGRPFQQYFMYEHAMATFALCEACAVAIGEGKTPDKRYLNAAEKAVQFIENVQHLDGGWRYTAGGNNPSDCSVSGWVMLALKTAREAKIKVLPGTLTRMMAFFTRHHAEDRTYYYSPSQQGTDAMTGVGMMAVEFFQHKLDSPIVTGGAAYLADKADHQHERGALPNCDYYLFYNCTMAMFQVGGDAWRRWNDGLRDHVISLQIQGDDCERGSWPPVDQWSGRGGRIYSTSLAVLTLEVYYRFQRVAGQAEKEKFFKK